MYVCVRTYIYIYLFIYLLQYNNPIRGLGRPSGVQYFEAPRFQNNRHMEAVRLSALRTVRLYPPGNIPGTHFCQCLSRPQGHSAAERIMSMKKSNETIGNRTRDLPLCYAVSQPTVPLRPPMRLLRMPDIRTPCKIY